MGVSGILVMLTLLAQMDKLVLTRLLTLDEFGYYSLAWTVASMLSSYLATPVTTSLFPRLVRAHNSADSQELARLYHLGCQLVALLVVPIAATLIAYAEPLLLAWTRDAAVADRAAPLLQLLVVGVGFNLLVAMAYSMQAAAGWNRLAFMIQGVSIPVMAALLLPAALRWGALGAAASWMVLYALHVLIGPYLMHRRLLGGEYRTWVMADLLAPIAAGALGVIFVRLVAPTPASTVGVVAVSGAAWLAGVAVQSVFSTRLHGHFSTLLASRS
jgi:O-antigen/teichoic acid export membrane protein